MERQSDREGESRIPRRSFLRSAAVLVGLPLVDRTGLNAGTLPRKGVFVDEGEIPRLRQKLDMPAMEHVRLALRQHDVGAGLRFLRSEASYKRRMWDMPIVCLHLRRGALLAAVWDERLGLELVREAFETLRTFPTWDYFLDGTEPIGLQRAPEAVMSVVFALELVGDRLPGKLREEMERQLATKGCAPCYRTLWGMEHPDSVNGWGFAPDAEVNLSEIDFTRWPIILRSTNLHAVPLAALGIGSLYLGAKDPRSELWLSTAVAHVADFCSRTILPDGAYIENVSYWGYAISNLALFLRAVERRRGLDLFDLSNFPEQLEFALAMQAGTRPVPGDPWNRLVQRDGQTPDVVNFSDSFGSFVQTAALAIAAKMRDPLAQRAGLERGGSWDEFTPVVYDPEVPAASTWPTHLMRKRFANDWVVWRTGWREEDVVVGFRSGGPANHEHADRNSVVLKAFGEWLLRDPVRAAYDRANEAWLLRLTEAHNAVLINGKGHAYIDGREGTNSSTAWARLRRYLERDNWLTLTSEATEAYQAVVPNVRRVVRTLVWLAPDCLLIVDQVSAKSAVEVAARFLPDNGDGAAVIETDETSFVLRRPRASLWATVVGTGRIRVTAGQLPLKSSATPYPYVQVAHEPAQEACIVTAAVVGRGDSPPARASVEWPGAGDLLVAWTGTSGTRSCRVHLVGEIPEVEV